MVSRSEYVSNLESCEVASERKIIGLQLLVWILKLDLNVNYSKNVKFSLARHILNSTNLNHNIK